jgi:hypothetical protein
MERIDREDSEGADQDTQGQAKKLSDDDEDTQGQAKKLSDDDEDTQGQAKKG